MIKIIMQTTEGKELQIATFTDLYNARQCRDLLQAMQSDQSRAVYTLEYYDKQQKRRRREGPEIFARLMPYMEKNQAQNVKLFLS